MYQYITDNKSALSVEEQVSRALDAGCRWIVLSTDGKTADEMKAIVEKIMHRCMETESFLLLDNDVDLAKELNVGGVLVRKGDVPPAEARVKLGAAAVVGAQTNSLQDVVAWKPLDIDYFCFGPYPETIDADKLAETIAEMKKMEIEIANVAYAPGIKFEELEKLNATGVQAVMVDSLDVLERALAAEKS